MLSKHIKLKIVHKIIITYIINIFIFTAYIVYSYYFAQNSTKQLEITVKQQLPISQLYSKNYKLLDDILTIFTDSLLTNKIDMLKGAEQKKEIILENFYRISTVDKSIDIKEEKTVFLEYYNFAYSFTKKLIKESSNDNLQEIVKAQKLSDETLKYFQKKKEFSSELLISSLDEISNRTNAYFTIALFLAGFGLIFMGINIIALYNMLKVRFQKIIESVKNLAVAKPDFSKRLTIGYNDEIGEIAKWFNNLQSKLEIDYKHLEELKKETEKSLMKEIEETQKEVIFTMGAIGESRSKETGNHVRRVAEYSKLLALYAGINEKEAELLKQASPMHDIGKVAIPDAILNKPGKHTYDEFEIMKKHSTYGYEMLKHSNRPLLKMAAIIAHEHHEKWDGNGYPRALKGEDINIFGRITAIADVFDALASDRVYKKAWEDERIFSFLKEQRGKHFDPNLVDIFLNNIDEFLVIRDKFKDDVVH